MRGKLQYAYTISVFFGVLVTSYLMMERDKSDSIPGQTISSPALRSEASAFDPAVEQLMQMEDAITKLRRDRPDSSKKRAPSDLESGREQREAD